MKKYKGIYTPVGESFGKDIENELTAMLSEELAKSIDRDIFRNMGFEPERNLRRKKSIEKIRGY